VPDFWRHDGLEFSHLVGLRDKELRIWFALAVMLPLALVHRVAKDASNLVGANSVRELDAMPFGADGDSNSLAHTSLGHLVNAKCPSTIETEEPGEDLLHILDLFRNVDDSLRAPSFGAPSIAGGISSELPSGELEIEVAFDVLLDLVSKLGGSCGFESGIALSTGGI